MREVNACRANGYAIENSEYKIGLCSTSAPVYTGEGKMRYTAGVIGMFRSVHSEEFHRAVEQVCATAAMISAALGCRKKVISMSYTAAVITVSDRGSQGLRPDTSGPAVCALLESAGFNVAHTAMVPDERERISAALRTCADQMHIDLIVTTGGTGLSPRDVTPEATLAVLEREIRAIPVAMWVEGLKVTPRAMLSRAVAGTRGRSLILNLPGSEKAARENLTAVLGALDHALHMMAAEGHE